MISVLSSICVFRILYLVIFRGLLLRLSYLIAVIDEWCRVLETKKLREDPAHSFVGTCTLDPTEDSCAQLDFPLSYVLAEFGLAIPNLGKFRVLWLEII